jgi:site-specific recombinase XerD
VAEQEFQTSGSELVQATSDVAALVELKLEDEVRRLAHGSRAESTWRAYGSDPRHFQSWCWQRNLSTLPADPQTVTTYLAALESTHSPSTIRRRLAAISVQESPG